MDTNRAVKYMLIFATFILGFLTAVGVTPGVEQVVTEGGIWTVASMLLMQLAAAKCWMDVDLGTESYLPWMTLALCLVGYFLVLSKAEASLLLSLAMLLVGVSSCVVAVRDAKAKLKKLSGARAR